MKNQDARDLTLVMEARELVSPEDRKRRQPNGITQFRAVASVVDMVGYDADLRYIRDLAVQEYGRFITLGCVLREKMVYRGKLNAS